MPVHLYKAGASSQLASLSMPQSELKTHHKLLFFCYFPLVSFIFPLSLCRKLVEPQDKLDFFVSS